ncbi:S9 family peptidase [Acanthopleuribacter pedis]|uniref:Acyl-peptide hydrolase n=1 Tax=Acanthopleuribacter pedis TaxID=442870 RepID=A0A8J7U661_9BACT|nr:S9 family peptidase [Acanthopleuribacter pedis]MBO1322442.1 S9 family peptidase [Acanthopleuribacter pedis]
MNVKRLFLCLLAAACFSLTLAEEPKRPMTSEDLWAMERIGAPKLSPDGRWVVYTQTVFSTDTNNRDSDLWLVPSDGTAPPRRLTWRKGGDSSPVWRPDSGAVLFKSKRGDGPSQYHLLPMNGGEARPLTNLPVSPSAAQWFPDGKRLLFMAKTWPDLKDDFEAVAKRLKEQKNDPTKAKISNSRLYRYWDHYLTDGSRNHLFVLDVATGEVRGLTTDHDLMFPFFSPGDSFDLSPDGTKIAMTAMKGGPDFQEINADVFVLDLNTNKLTAITADNPAFDAGPVFTPDGKSLLYQRNQQVNIAPDRAQLVRYDFATGKYEAILRDWEESVGGVTFTQDGKTVIFSAGLNGHTQLFSAPLKGGKVKTVFGEHTNLNLHAAAGKLVFTQESIGFPARLQVLQEGEKTPKLLADPNAERMAGLDLGHFESWTFSGADNAEVQMFVAFPPGFDAEKKWPLVHMIHGGPHGAFMDRFHYRWNQALFAAPGYVVAAVNFHGSTGFGKDFTASILGNHAEKPFEDIMKATDVLIGKGYIDAQRMAATGGSYGGYMVSWILGHTDRFACLINHAGVYDLMGQFASDYTWGRANNYGAAPHTDPNRIDLYSPSRYAANFNTPTLILHGKKDYRVPYTQGLNLHGVLTAKGVPSRLVVFPEENHWILKPKAGVLWWKEVHDWLGHYLKPGS